MVIILVVSFTVEHNLHKGKAVLNIFESYNLIPGI